MLTLEKFASGLVFKTRGAVSDLAIAEPDADELLSLDRCLYQLEQRDAAMARVVKLRFFAGLTVDETAAALDISRRRVARLWSAARAWLRREMRPHGSPA